MTTRISPPVFGKGKNYEHFKQELLAWREITDLSKAKQGIAVALSLPDNDESQIREKVFDQLQIDELKCVDGFNVLLQFLDQHLAKDDLTDSLEKFEDFEDFKRLDGQSINEFVAIFDSKYRKIEKKNMPLPPEILAFKLLKKANISKEEKLLVLTGMNYGNRKTLYEEAKKSLKKFKANDDDRSSQRNSIKLEPAFLAANEEALLAAGYTKTRRKMERNYNRDRGCSWNGGNLTQSHLRENRTGEPDKKNKGLTKKINPTGPDGRLLTCKSCGSFRHMLRACPDSWENMKNVNTVEEENVVLYTGVIGNNSNTNAKILERNKNIHQNKCIQKREEKDFRSHKEHDYINQKEMRRNWYVRPSRHMNFRNMRYRHNNGDGQWRRGTKETWQPSFRNPSRYYHQSRQRFPSYRLGYRLQGAEAAFYRGRFDNLLL